VIKYDLPYPYIDGLILRTTSKIGQIQVEHQPRREGKSGYTFRKLVALWLNMFTNFSIVPLRISIYLGVIFAIFGFIMGVYSIIEKILNPDLPRGYAMLITAVSMFSGIILIAIGMAGEYIGRIFLSFNKKPQFTVRKKFL
jgi:undecaprenyl-phosphate 4-deoxy-4-formamido-L-arabinose transferase